MANTVEERIVFEADASQVASELQRYERGLVDVERAQSDVERAGRSANRLLVQSHNESTRAIDNQAEALEDLREEVLRYDQAQRRAQQTPGRGQANGLRGAGAIDRAGTIGSQVLGGVGAGELGNVAGLIGDIASSFEGLQLKGLALSGGLLALGVAMDFYNSSNERAAQSVRNLIASQESYTRLLVTGTSEQVQARLDEIQTERQILQARIDENRAVFTALEEQIGGVGRAITDATNLAGSRQLREETQRLESELASTSLEFNRLTSGLTTGATAARDAAEAERQLQEAREAYNQRALAIISETFLSSINSSSGDVSGRIANITSEIDALREAIASGLLDESAASAAIDRLRDLYKSLEILQNVVAPLVAAREKEQLAIDGVLASKQRYLEQLEKEATLADQTAQAIKDAYLAEIEAERERAANLKAAYAEAGEEIDKAGGALDKARAALSEALNDTRLAELETELGEDRVERFNTFARQQTQAQEDLQDRLARITRDAGDEIQDAIAKREGGQNALARRQRDRALKDAEDDAKKQQQRQRENFDASLRDFDRQAQRRLQSERDAAARELMLRQSAYNAAYNDLQVSLLNERNIRAVLNKTMLDEANAWASSFGATIKGAFMGAQPVFGGGGGLKPAGLMPYTSPVITLNVQGATMGTIKATSEAQAREVFGSVLKQIGVR